MTDDRDLTPGGAEQEVPAQQKDVTLDQPEGTDWHLASIVDLSATLGLEIDVTVYVSGLIVTGTVISPRRYFEIIEEQLRKANTTGGVEGLAESVAKLISRYKDLFPAVTPDGPKLGETLYSYLHLRNVIIFKSDGHLMQIREGAWRAKMSAIDAFNFGRAVQDG